MLIFLQSWEWDEQRLVNGIKDKTETTPWFVTLYCVGYRTSHLVNDVLLRKIHTEMNLTIEEAEQQMV